MRCRSLIPLVAIAFTLSIVTGAGAGVLRYVPGSTEKICQLTGDYDRGAGAMTLSLTHKRYGVEATDLGSSFEHQGRLYFLFGDTWGRPGALDAVAWTESTDPERIILDFHRAQDGKWLPPNVPGITQGAFEVPSGGISIGDSMYVVFTTGHSARKTMGRSVLARSIDGGQTFEALYELSRDRFLNVSFCLAGEWIYIFGSGEYRKSSVCLARVRPEDIGDRSKLEYYAVGVGSASRGESAASRGGDAASRGESAASRGGDAAPDGGDAAARWSRDETGATPIFRHDVVGEFSVAYLQQAECYVMLYNSGEPRGITMRSAERPWGPWSGGVIVFEPWRDDGYGHFMHVSSDFKPRADKLSDPGRDREWGGEYGPYIMERFAEETDGVLSIYYTMSTWNPYQVVVMRSAFRVRE